MPCPAAHPDSAADLELHHDLAATLAVATGTYISADPVNTGLLGPITCTEPCWTPTRCRFARGENAAGRGYKSGVAPCNFTLTGSLQSALSGNTKLSIAPVCACSLGRGYRRGDAS